MAKTAPRLVMTWMTPSTYTSPADTYRLVENGTKLYLEKREADQLGGERWEVVSSWYPYTQSATTPEALLTLAIEALLKGQK